MKSFLLKLIGITLGVAVLGKLAFTFLFDEYYLSIFPYLFSFFFVVTIVIHAYQLKLTKKDIGKFARSNMLITFFKLILFSVVTVVYIAVDSENALAFVICLMILYLIFTFFEVFEITKRSKTNPEK